MADTLLFQYCADITVAPGDDAKWRKDRFQLKGGSSDKKSILNFTLAVIGHIHAARITIIIIIITAAAAITTITSTATTINDNVVAIAFGSISSRDIFPH